MKRRGQCKFYAQGRCLKGEFCEFAHDLKMTPPNKVCMFYQRGTCSFGSRCRYEHSKTSLLDSSAASSSLACVLTTSNDSAIGTNQNPSVIPVLSSIANNPTASSDSAITTAQEPSIGNISPLKPEQCAETGENDRLICSLAADGNCPLGESCEDIHGDLCSTCGKYCLHPSKPKEREKHVKECEKKQALEHSQEIECSVCLERVLSKTSASERKFGLLSECDHAFCIACIKKWRSSSSSSPGIEVNSAARACPLCRKVSYYVIPSLIWSSSKEEKQEIINKYKSKLKSIDCRYFNFGNGHCRHGPSCFYKHEVKAGSSRCNNKSSKAKHKHNSSRQNRAIWDDDDSLGFGEFVQMAALGAMLDDFEELFFVNEEAMEGGAPGDEVPESLTDLLMRLEEMTYSGDPDYGFNTSGASRLEPWQRQIFYEETGYHDFDDYSDYRNFDYYFGSGTRDFGSDDD